MKKRREHKEVIISILRLINKETNGIGKTNLMYSSNLSCKDFKKYSDLFLQRGLIEIKEVRWNSVKVRSKTKKRIFLTNLGRQFLSEYERLNNGLIKLEEKFLKWASF